MTVQTIFNLLRQDFYSKFDIFDLQNQGFAFIIEISFFVN